MTQQDEKDLALGRLVRHMLPNSALFKHNDDTWTWRTCVMDVLWTLPFSKPLLPRDSGYKGQPDQALEEMARQEAAWGEYLDNL
jgi:hypothetical protein